MKKTRHWVLTGGAGFIGSEIARELVRRGERVSVLDDFSSSSPQALHGIRSRIRLVRGSILDEKILRQTFRGADFVLHLAAVASVAESFINPAQVTQVNVQGTANVLEYARLCGVKRLLFASSSSVYGRGGKTPRKETMPPHPLSPYAFSKLMGEELCALYGRTYGLNWSATRCFNVYGPGQNASSAYAAVLAGWTARAAAGATLTLNGDGLQTRDFLHVSDAARAILTVAEQGENGEIYNVGNGRAVTLRRAFALLEKTAGRKLNLIHGPAREGDVRYSSADTAKLRALGFEPAVSLGQGLKELWAAKTGAGTHPAAKAQKDSES